MTYSREKDWLDVAVDFFYGAILNDFLWLALIRFPPRGRHPLWELHFQREGWCLYFLSGALMGGALLALFRYRWSEPSLLPPIGEHLSGAKRIALWTIFALGCSSAGFLLWFH